MNLSYNGSMGISLNKTTNEENLHLLPVLVFTVVSVFIISTNSFVVVFLCKIKDDKLRDKVSILLSLSFCDITLGIGGFLLSITRIFHFCFKSYAIVTFVFIVVGIVSSVYQTLFICIERFLAVAKLTIQKKVFGRRGRFIITFSSLIAFFIAFLCVKMIIADEIQVCTLAGIYGEHYHLFIRVYFFGLYIPPLIVIIALYLYTVYRIKVQCRQIGAVLAPQTEGVASTTTQGTNLQQLKNQTSVFMCGTETGNKSSGSRSAGNTTEAEPIPCRSNVGSNIPKMKTRLRTKHNAAYKSVTSMKAIRLVGIIIITMVFTTGAGSILFSVEAVCTECEITINLRAVVTAFWFLNSVMNPIIYTFGIEEFRLSIAKTFHCKTSAVTST